MEDVILIHANVKVELTYIGEGYSGDYDDNDPDDKPLVRFYVYRFVDQGWEAVEDASYCTQLPTTTPDALLYMFASIIMQTVKEKVENDESVKKLCASLSWRDPHTLV